MNQRNIEAVTEITQALLTWYDRSARTLPWRNIRDPYRTWVSEIMLQQTRVETVIPYYERFLRRFPTLSSLAGAREEDVLKMWQGLGYYSRARNLLSGARQVMRDYGGVMPQSPDELRKITGIGPYTACAIASIAWNQPFAAVDGNVIRVVSRLFGVREIVDRADVRRRLQDLAGSLVPPDRPGDHNQAMMDLGAEICVPGTPDCRRCPLSDFCDARIAGDASALPRLPKAKKPKTVPCTVLIIFLDDRILARQRTEKMLRGMWCFPMLEGHFTAEDLRDRIAREFHLSPLSLRFETSARHVFTHRIWEMEIWTCTADAASAPPKGYVLLNLRQLRGLPWPVAMVPALDCLGVP